MIFLTLVCLELRALIRDRQGMLMPILFLLVLTAVFPFALSVQGEVLQQYAAGISWLGVMLSMLLGFDRFFRDEREHGLIEQLLAGGIHTVWHMQARILAHWIASLPLVFGGLLVAFFCAMPIQGYFWLLLALLAGCLVMVSLAAFTALLAVIGQGTALLPLVLLLPLQIPVGILTLQIVADGIAGHNPDELVMLLTGIALINLVVSPVLIAVAVRTVLD